MSFSALYNCHKNVQVQKNDKKYSYGGHPLTNSGIFAMLPKDSAYLGENYSYKLTLTIGYTDFTASDVNLLLESMTPDFSGDQYHLLHKNCNHFADAFVQILCGRSLPKWINRLATIAAKLPFIERSLPVEWLTPHQQFADQMNDQLDGESQQSPDEEHSINSNTTAAGNSHSPFRRWSAIDRLQNSLLHRFHHNTTKYAKRPTTQNRHRRSLTTNAKYDTCSLFDLPSDENTVENDTDWYAFITAQSTTTLSEPNIISICRQQGVKNCSSDSSTSNPTAVVNSRIKYKLPSYPTMPPEPTKLNRYRDPSVMLIKEVEDSSSSSSSSSSTSSDAESSDSDNESLHLEDVD
ncbi:unnamed protein product [Trichobilharzia szidati]|nr:unnamed protein product [Trichobilharzia szidati]